MRARLALLVAVALVGCKSGKDLRVDLVTDLVPGFELFVVEVDLYDERPQLGGGDAVAIERLRTAYFDYTADLVDGVNLGDFGGLPNGEHWLVARFYSSDMDVIARQMLQVQVRGDTAVTILLTRDCAGVMCPMSGDDAGHLACLRGECVDPRCPQDPSFCPDPECTEDADCDDFDGFDVAECARMVCTESYCFAGAVPGGCPEGEFCHPSLGCRMLGGDAGIDGGMDCRSVGCNPGSECRVGAIDCTTGTCSSIGYAFEGAECDVGECDASGNCLGPRIVVEVFGAGGQVVSEPAGIACGLVCEARFARGSTVVLNALPDLGYHFVEWTGACGGETEPMCVVTADRSLPTLGAVFEPDAHDLNVTRDGDGSGTVSGMGIDCGSDCDEPIVFGQSVTLTATADAGSTFAGWGGACTGLGDCTFTVDGDASVNATFVSGTDFLTVTRSGTGMGTVSSAPAGINCGASCAAGFPSGTMVSLSAIPSLGSSFVGWIGACTGTGACSVTVSGMQMVGAEFELGMFPLDVIKEGVGDGQILSAPAGIDCGATCTASFDFGERVTLTATPDALSDLVGWTGGGCSGAGACVVDVTMATTVRAQFGPRPIRVDAEVQGAGGGVITSMPTGISCAPDCAEDFAAGTTVTFNASPAVGSRVVGMGRDCVGMTCTDFTPTAMLAFDVMAPTRVSAFFELLTYSLDVATNGAGSGTITSDIGGIDCGATCSGTFTHGQTVMLTAAAAGGSTFAGWGGACASAGANPTCSVDMTMARNATATFVPDAPTMGTLTVTRAGGGSGLVSSAPAGIDCGSTCAGSFPLSTMVTLTATAGSGSDFAGWGGACAAAGMSPSCDVTIAMTNSVTATFDRQTFTVTVNKTGTGAGLVSSVGGEIDCGATCAVVVDYGTMLTLTSSADPGSSFGGWSGGGCSGTGACNLSVTSNVTLAAPFTLSTHTLSVSTTGDGGGTISSAPAGIDCGSDCTQVYDYGTMVTLTPSADVGSGFIGWSGACTGMGACVVSMTAARSVVARFDADRHAATVALAGTGVGTITSTPVGINCGVDCTEDYAYGTMVTLSSTPAASSTFGGWSGACTGMGACVLDMTAARNVTATHDIRTYDLTVSALGPGTITGAGINCGVDCSETFDHGTMVTLTATAMGAGSFSGWGGACAAEISDTCTVTMTAARSVSASFATGNTLNVTVTGSGTVTSAPAGINCPGDCSEDYAIGQMVTLSATPGANHDFSGWSGACTGTGSCVVTMSAARSVTATYTLQQRTLTVTNDTTGVGGVITSAPAGINCGGDCIEAYDHGTSVTLSATTNMGAVFNGWSGAGCSGTGDCMVTMTAARAVTGTFVPERFTLDVNVIGLGTGTIDSAPAGIAGCGNGIGDCSEDYDFDTMVTLSATRDLGMVFDGWSGAGCSGTGACVVRMDQAHTVTAAFEPERYDLNVMLAGTGTGIVRVDMPMIDCPASECSAQASYGTVSTFMMMETGDTFTGWGGDCASFGTDPMCMVMVTGPVNVTATFDAPTVPFALRLSPPGVGFVVVTIDGVPQPMCMDPMCIYQYVPGDLIELEAMPAPAFSNWGVGLCGGQVVPLCSDRPPPDTAEAVF